MEKILLPFFLSGPIVVAAPRLEVRLAGLADEALLVVATDVKPFLCSLCCASSDIFGHCAITEALKVLQKKRK